MQAQLQAQKQKRKRTKIKAKDKIKRKPFSVTPQNPEVYDEFKKYVIRKYGKLHTVLAIELENAINAYLAADAAMHVEAYLAEKAIEERASADKGYG